MNTTTTVRIENLGSAFDGWVRCNTDAVLGSDAVQVAGMQLVLGRRTGLDTRALDIRCQVGPGQRHEFDLAAGDTGEPFVRGPLPDDPTTFFGGVAMVADSPMRWMSFEPDGAGYTAHLRWEAAGLSGVVDLWLTWYPDMPGIARGEVIDTASNPSIPDLFATLQDTASLTFGDAIVVLPGRGTNLPLITAGTKFADGQARAIPVVFVWPRLLKTAADWSTAGAVANMAVNATAIGQLLPDGNPIMAPGFDPHAWAAQRIAPALARLHSWEPAVCGPARRSTDTGAQEDQVFVRGEALVSAPAALVTYLSALKLANRPCHHREANGDLLSLSTHPTLRMWQMRPDKRLTTDLLGKPRDPSLADWDVPGGWWGADDEHLLYNTPFAGARVTGSKAIQCLLSTVARNFLYDHPANAGSGARATGWEGIFAVHCWRELEDRGLAEIVADRWRARFDHNAPNLLALDTKVNHWGPGTRWQPWMESVKCYGMDLAGAHLGRPQARTLALQHAKRVLAEAFVKVGDRWTTRDNVVVGEGIDATLGSFDRFGTPLAIATILRHEPQHEQARAVWTQLLAESRLPKETAWLAPGVP